MIISLQELGVRCGVPLKQVLHIGAHYGEECAEYFEQGATDVTFVEPALATFIELHKRLGMRRGVRLYHTALGPYNGQSSMHCESTYGGASSSLLLPKIHTSQYPHIVFNSRETVTVMRCDDLFSREGFDFISIDVQGYELEVFKGSVETLKTVQAISAEINREELYEGCALVGDLDNFLEGQGFNRIATDWCGNTWGDGIYTRNK